MKRLLYTILLATPAQYCLAESISDSSSADTVGITTTLPNLEVTDYKESRSVTSSTPLHKIDSKIISEAGVTDISDAMKRLPGVNLRDYGGAGGLKTVSVRGLGAQHTGVSYDGVPLSDIRSGEIDLSRYSLNNVSSLSLSAGDTDDIFIPARALSSASSLAISTANLPSIYDKGITSTIRMKAGSFSMYNPYLSLGWGNGSNLSTSISSEFFHAKNDFPFTLQNGTLVTKERRENSQMNSVNAEFNILYSPREGESIGGKLYFYNNARYLPGPVIYYVEGSKEHLHDRNFFGQTRWKRRLSSIFSVMALAKFNFSTSRYQDEKGIYPGGKLDQYYIQRETYLSGSILCTPASFLTLDYSADWFWNNLTSNLPSYNHPYRNSILQSFTARFSYGPLSLTARALYSIYIDRARESEREGNKVAALKSTADRLSPSLSLSIRPVESFPFYIRASYKNIFRMPTFNELYFDNYGSVNLQPEITDQFNLGLTASFPSREILKEASVTVDGYYNKVRNKIVAIPYNLFKWTMTNLGKVRIYGLDLTMNAEIQVKKLHSLLLCGSYSYQRAMPVTSPEMLDYKKQVAYTPLNSGSGSLSWLNPWLSAAIHFTGSSARYTTNNNLPSTKVAGYMDFGLSLFRKITLPKGKLEVRGDLLNLFNAQYQIVAHYPMPGRNWTISLAYTL